MRTWISVLVWALFGCGTVSGKQSDAGMPFDSAQDASSVCDQIGTFDAPVPLTRFNMENSAGTPRLTADELELYFSASLGTADADIYRAQRSTSGQPFGAPVALSITANESNPSVSSDGLTLLFESSRVSGEGTHLYVSTRTSRIGEFGAASKVANVNSTTVTDADAQAFLTADGQELWFASNRAGGLGDADIYRAVRNGSGFASVAAITALSSSGADWLPTLSADKLTIYLASSRAGGKGGFDIWTAHRSTASDGFPAPTPVPELNSGANEYPGWLSPDNCRLYFTSDIAGSQAIYVATRHPL